jgi:hypothetical protein
MGDRDKGIEEKFNGNPLPAGKAGEVHALIPVPKFIEIDAD